MFENIMQKLGLMKSSSKEEEKVKPEEAAALLLLQVAYSDDEFSDSEKEALTSMLKDEFSFDEETIKKFIGQGEKILEEDTNKWRYVNSVNENYSPEEKEKLLDSIWKIVYADGRLDKYEDHIVHKLSSMLHIPHETMISSKIRVKSSVQL